MNLLGHTEINAVGPPCVAARFPRLPTQTNTGGHAGSPLRIYAANTPKKHPVPQSKSLRYGVFPAYLNCSAVLM